MARPVSQWPALSRLCLDCRTALAADEGCAPEHRVIDPRAPDGAEALRTALWGTPAQRRRLRRDALQPESPRLASRVVFALALASGLAAIVAPGPLLLVAPLIAAAAAVAFMGGLSVRRVRGWLGHGRQPLMLPPAGALEPPPAAAAADVYEGRVVDDGAARTPPFGGAPAVAYGLWLWRDDALLLCEQVCRDFELETDDGARVRIAGGRCRIGPAPSIPHTASLSWALQRYVDHRAGYRARTGLFPLLPVDRAAIVAIAPGDRVRIRADTEIQPDARAPVGDYRAGHRAVIVASGPVELTTPAPAG